MRIFLVTLFTVFCFGVKAQFGGSYTYAYLNMSPSARISGLSGLNINTYDQDVSFVFQNPALLNPLMNNRLSVNHALTPGVINQGTVGYAMTLKNKPDITMGGGILYRAYGTFKLTDEAGNQAGTFSGSEYAMQWGIAYGQNKLHYGVSAKLLYSQLESYSSFGMAADLGAIYVDTAKLFTAALVMRNAGTQFKPFVENNYEELPFEIDLAFSKRLKHLPLRVSFTMHDLQSFDLRYDDPDAVNDANIFGTDSTVTVKNYTIDKIARHLNIAGEFYFGKNFMVRGGYDHQTRKELSIETRRGLTGFALGFGFKVNKFSIDYGHEFYSQAGGTNHIGISANLNEVFK